MPPNPGSFRAVIRFIIIDVQHLQNICFLTILAEMPHFSALARIS